MKGETNVQEYGVQQTSLEQIFQTFAQQSIDEGSAFTFKVNALDQLMLMNPDRKSTMLQKRMSQIGRKSESSGRKSAVEGLPVEESDSRLLGNPDNKH